MTAVTMRRDIITPMSDYPTRPCICPTCSGIGSVSIPDLGALISTRVSLGLSQSAVARAAGWQASVVSEMESGARPLTEASATRYWLALSGGRP